ncbi:hypothetical protein DTO169C6_3992 [Paecilomyces variotii]|nr:hypothetical protein DTO169C6_3992 [Paecilomyces variotii]KAJ9380242.1 hypothetical protein DTO063F5_6817 [Paecilomyces variotii]
MDEIQIQLLSDLHLETPSAYDIFTITPKAPFLALLGDIGYVKDDGFFDFIRTQLQRFRVVFLVLGNHEPYHSNWTETKSKVLRFKHDADHMFQEGEITGKFILLDQTRFDISATVTILGCTLFSHVTADQAESVNFGLNDFYHIDDWSVEKHQEAHVADLTWLNTEIDSISRFEPQRKIVVFTHYCPSTHETVIDPRHRNSRISSGFMTDLKMEQCWQRNNVKLWAFGHTHFNCDFQDAETGKRVVSNQRGYYFAQAAGFNSEMVVRI